MHTATMLKRTPDSHNSSRQIPAEAPGAVPSSEDILERAIESAVVRSIFGHNELSRRSFASMLGASTLAGIIGSVFPMEEAKAAILDKLGHARKEEAESRLRADHLRHTDHHGEAARLL